MNTSLARNMIRTNSTVSPLRLFAFLHLTVLIGILVARLATTEQATVQDDTICLFKCNITLRLDTREFTCESGGEWKCAPVLEWMLSTGYEGRR